MGADVVSILGQGEAEAFVEAANGLDYVSKTRCTSRPKP